MGHSWNPRRNRYERRANAAAPQHFMSYAFDRIFYAGAVSAQAFLVGYGRLFSEGLGFCLSDHFGVLGLVDVHKDNVGASRSSPAFVNRQTALARLRDDVCLQEQCAAAELASAGRQAGPAQRALAEAARTTSMLKQARAAAAVERGSAAL